MTYPSSTAVRLLATYFAKEDARDVVLVTLKQWLQDTNMAGNFVLQIIGGTIFYLEENYEEAMRCVYQTAVLEG